MSWAAPDPFNIASEAVLSWRLPELAGYLVAVEAGCREGKDPLALGVGPAFARRGDYLLELEGRPADAGKAGIGGGGNSFCESAHSLVDTVWCPTPLTDLSYLKRAQAR
jgi:hypothetical protein